MYISFIFCTWVFNFEKGSVKSFIMVNKKKECFVITAVQALKKKFHIAKLHCEHFLFSDKAAVKKRTEIKFK